MTYVFCIGEHGGLCDPGCEKKSAADCPKNKRPLCAFRNNTPCIVNCNRVTGEGTLCSFAENVLAENAFDPKDFYRVAEIEYKDLKDFQRGNYLGFHEAETLDSMCGLINKAFGSTCYLVGSATKTKEFRDVDVRLIMADDEFDLLFGNTAKPPLWSVVCNAISVWISDAIKLPVDFQIQKQSRANAIYRGQTRNALGITYGVPLDGDQLPAFLRGTEED